MDLSKVVITELKDSTFYARLCFKNEKGEWDVDARPSDSIALALRMGAPIYVEDEVLDVHGVDQEPKIKGKTRQFITLQNQLQDAIEKEDFEAAAKLRDQIKDQRLALLGKEKGSENIVGSLDDEIIEEESDVGNDDETLS